MNLGLYRQWFELVKEEGIPISEAFEFEEVLSNSG
jgi:dynein heavy chain, axonemal